MVTATLYNKKAVIRPEPAPQEANIGDIIALAARLAQVLAEEADCLEQMQISKMQDLQKEKLLLTGALEKQKKQFDRMPNAFKAATPEDRSDLKRVVEIFQGIVKENYRRLLIARDVNQSIVSAVGDVVNDITKGSVYDKRGTPDHIAREQLSITLNQTA